MLDPRLPNERVRSIVELLHANRMYTPRERIGYANRRRFNPYPAEILRSGMEIICGHEPYLRARLVDRLKVEGDAPDSKQLSWQDRRPRHKKDPPG